MIHLEQASFIFWPNPSIDLIQNEWSWLKQYWSVEAGYTCVCHAEINILYIFKLLRYIQMSFGDYLADILEEGESDY